MNLTDIVNLLRSQGHKVVVKVSREAETGIKRRVIKKIDGISYSGKTGNKKAREMTGFSVSSTTSQRRSIAGRKGGSTARLKGDSVLTASDRKAIAKVNRYLKRMGKKERISLAKAREKVIREGRRALLDSLGNVEWHYSGYAYPENVRALIDRLRTAINKMFEKGAFAKSIWWAKHNIYNLYDDAITTTYEILYRWQNLEFNDDVADNMIASVLSAGRINTTGERFNPVSKSKAHAKASAAARKGWETRRKNRS